MVLIATGPNGSPTPRYRETQDGAWRLQLVTEVRSDGVYVRFAPLQRSFRSIPFAEIEIVTRERYSAVDYGGWHWGVRVGPSGDDAVYRISGVDGVQLRLADGTRVFIGSQRPEELRDTILGARDDT